MFRSKGASANTAMLGEVKRDADDIVDDVDKLRDEFRSLARQVDQLTLAPATECAPSGGFKPAPLKRLQGKKKRVGGRWV
jgi:hypothetical protein